MYQYTASLACNGYVDDYLSMRTKQLSENLGKINWNLFVFEVALTYP